MSSETTHPHDVILDNLIEVFDAALDSFDQYTGERVVFGYLRDQTIRLYARTMHVQLRGDQVADTDG